MTAVSLFSRSFADLVVSPEPAKPLTSTLSPSKRQFFVFSRRTATKGGSTQPRLCPISAMPAAPRATSVKTRAKTASPTETAGPMFDPARIDRRREIGVFRAVGSFRGQVRRMILYEAQAVGLIGAFLGIAVGIPLSWLYMLAAERYTNMGYEYIFPAAGVAIAGFTALGISLVAALMSANQASKVSIVDALKHD